MSVKERLIEFIESNGISIREFERVCGLPYTTVNNMKTSIQPEKLLNIYQQFPELNFVWLLIGQEQMLNTNYGNTTTSDTNPNIKDAMDVETTIRTLNERIIEKEKQITELLVKVANLEGILSTLGKQIGTLRPGDMEAHKSAG